MQQGLMSGEGSRARQGTAGPGALLALCAAQFIVVLSFQGAAITLPLMQGAFGASPVVGQWLVSANALAFGGLLLLTLFGFRSLPTGFIPNEDLGFIVVSAQLPDSASLERTDAVVEEIAPMWMMASTSAPFISSQ